MTALLLSAGMFLLIGLTTWGLFANAAERQRRRDR